jgi:hypothetical protein
MGFSRHLNNKFLKVNSYPMDHEEYKIVVVVELTKPF